MRTTGQLTDGLEVVEMHERPIKMGEIKGLRERQRLNRPTNIIELFHAANTAAGASGQRATTLFQPHKSTAGKLNLHFKSVTG